MADAQLGANHHGKGLVRLVKVYRGAQRHEIKQFTVETILHGPVDASFTAGDNSVIVATDTQKNTVYALARRHSFHSPEAFALILARHFVTTYPDLVHRCQVTVEEAIWERLGEAAGRPHRHAFKKSGPSTGWARAVHARRGLEALQGGVRQLTLLKTTQSSFTNFHRDEYTLLPEAEDRILASAVDATWDYDLRFAGQTQDFAASAAGVLAALTDAFVGPTDRGVHSPSVQATAYQMGCRVVNSVPGVDRVTLYLPNIHNIPVNLTPLGLENRDHTGEPDVFVATSEPHGIIQCTVHKRGKAKL